MRKIKDLVEKVKNCDGKYADYSRMYKYHYCDLCVTTNGYQWGKREEEVIPKCKYLGKRVSQFEDRTCCYSWYNDRYLCHFKNEKN